MTEAADSVLDTNVLVYAVSRTATEAAKRGRALSLIERERFGLSGQILQEFYVTITQKGRKPLPPAEALQWIEQLEAFPCVPIDSGLVKAGAAIAERYRISYWDGAVLAAARRLGASTLYTEDLNDGQSYDSVTVRNPFLSA